MPFLKIQTNAQVSWPDELLKKATLLLSDVLSKPEGYIMVSFESNPHMMFGGSEDPLMYIELKSIGLPQSRTKAISAALTEFLTGETGVPPDRIYIEFSNVDRAMWGWNGSTFA